MLAPKPLPDTAAESVFFSTSARTRGPKPVTIESPMTAISMLLSLFMTRTSPGPRARFVSRVEKVASGWRPERCLVRSHAAMMSGATPTTPIHVLPNRIALPPAGVLDVLELEIQGAHRELGLQPKDVAGGIVGQPDFRLAGLGEQAFGLDLRLEDEGVEFTGGDLDPLSPVDADDHRVALGVVVPVELVGLADLERHGSHEIDERPFVERFGDARLFLPVADVDLALRVELVRLVCLVARFVDVLDVLQRDERCGIEPALVVIVDVKDEDAAFDVEDGVISRSAADVLDADDFHGRGAGVDEVDLRAVRQAFADSKWHAAAVGGRRRG